MRKRIERIRQWLDEHVANRRRAPITGVAVAIATVLFWISKEALAEVLGNAAGSALFGGPLWLTILIGVLLFVGAVATIASVLGRRSEPKPDEPPESSFGPPVLPKALSPLVGRRAIGTSAFMLHAAESVKDQFPDGHIHLDLRGAGAPLSGSRALRRVLHRLGLAEPRSNRPDDLDAAADTLHDWLASRTILIVLDNVDHRDQIARLLPGSPSCRMLLAGSVDLMGLPGVSTFHLHELSEDDAVDLLRSAGDPAEVDTDPATARYLVNLTGRQPLAVRLLGQLIRDEHWPLQRITDAVRQSLAASPYARSTEHAELQPLWDACDLAYRELSPAHRRLFRLLALVPSTEIGAHAAAAVVGMSPEHTTRLLGELSRRGLVESGRSGHYRVRQLLAPSARFHLEQEDSPRQLDRARLRLARYYALVAERYAEPLAPGPVEPGQQDERQQALDEARSWFAHEHELLFRLATGRHLEAADRADLAGDPVTDRAAGMPTAEQQWLWRLAVSLCIWYADEGRFRDWQKVCEAVLAMPLCRSDPAAESWAHNELGVLYRLRSEPLEAWEELSIAAKLRRRRGRRGMAQVRTNLGLALLDQGEVTSALHELEPGLALRSRGDRHGRAASELGLGAAYLRANELTAARRHLSHAANSFDGLNDQRGLAAALNNLGVVLWEQDDRLGAAEHWELARSVYRELDDDQGLACVLLNAAAGLLAAEPATEPEPAAAARDLLTESLRLRAGQPETHGTGLAHLHLGEALERCGDHDLAGEHRRLADAILARFGDHATEPPFR